MKTNYPFSVWSIHGVGSGITLRLQHSSPSQPRSTQPRVLATCKAVISSFPIVSFLQTCKQTRASTTTALWKAAFPQTKQIQEIASPQYFTFYFEKCKTATIKRKNLYHSFELTYIDTTDLQFFSIRTVISIPQCL